MHSVTHLLSYSEKTALLPTLKLEDHPLSAVRDLLFNVFAVTFYEITCKMISLPDF
jgi:hypothetical protein